MEQVLEATTGNRLVWILLLRVPPDFTEIYIESGL
ncbi:hypothetical protein ACP70R_006330 [Stipagrostis hirtigluma subsp. patula]